MIQTTVRDIDNAATLTELTADNSLIYNIPTQEDVVYFPRSEFHSRFGCAFDMNKVEVFDTYHRSSAKRLAGVKKSDFTFEGNQTEVVPRMFPKTGNFYNPYHFSKYQEAVKYTEDESPGLSNAGIYDALLKRQQNQAKMLAEKLKSKLPNLSVNADNNYPCVMVAFPKPAAEKNVKTWTSLIGIFYVAIINKLVMENGINIETHLRASFSAYRPSIAECGYSLRLSLGVVPNEFINCAVEAIGYINTLISLDNTHNEDDIPVWKIPVEVNELSNNLDRYNNLNDSNISTKENLWDSLWAPGDKSGRSFASQVFRKTHTVETLTDLILNELLKDDLRTIFSDREKIKSCFAIPLMKLFKNYECTGKSLGFNLTHNLQSYQWKDEAEIKDTGFWSIIKKIFKVWRLPQEDVDNIANSSRTTHLHTLLDHLSHKFCFSPYAYDDLQDGCGSDSEEEEQLELDNEKLITLYAKKLITATGMRAIQLSYNAAKTHMADKKIDPLAVSYDAKSMYYETDDAITRHPIPIDTNKNYDGRKKGHIGFFDLNHCNAMQVKKQDSILNIIYPKDTIAVIDTTSSTTSQMRSVIKKLFTKRKNLEAIILVSSGLKNEQAMSDNNPYGTARIFAKTDTMLDELYNCLVVLENDASYLHPKLSHALRKSAKDNGMVPTNQTILQASP